MALFKEWPSVPGSRSDSQQLEEQGGGVARTDVPFLEIAGVAGGHHVCQCDQVMNFSFSMGEKD